MRKPEFEDFGVTPEQYAQYRGVQKKEISILSQLVGWTISISVFVWFELGPGWLSAAAEPLFVAWGVTGALIIPFVSVVFVFVSDHRASSRDVTDALCGGFFVGIFAPLLIPVGIGWFVQWSAVVFKKRRLHKSPVALSIKLYEDAVVSYQATVEETEKLRQKAERQRREDERARQAALLAEERKREQYWESLGGIEFERELGKLFGARGYRVEFTPTVGDQGIDLILRKDGKTTVVQCKAHSRPVGPAVARELYGSMVAYKADNAILACTGGFTDGVFKFAQGKPIRLISSRDIARVAEATGGEVQDTLLDGPICPNDECGRTMVLRKGYRGRFWGCPRYPACRGTRQL